MKLCLSLNIPFVVPLFIVQDGSAAEGNAAMSVFGPTTKILMCWYHLVYNVKKWFKKAERGVDKLLATQRRRGLLLVLEEEFRNRLLHLLEWLLPLILCL